ncbi:hypothetical protein [Laspinema olomoucense]|uniref:hypothetical protein n=1 Tax=Laspinema olomoucense TaxID=3231600 RepID=UPI0021BA9417|nr:MULTISPECIES: hypothetical protein [unclassified Laspinema]MCT7989925.1 hypothetical protein [Laspinema sp. D3a]MCT7995515.1 hypothetical protein [Laspinema sp. D3c]
MIASFIMGSVTSLVPALTMEDLGLRLMFITASVSSLWVIALFVTQPETEATLNEFYRQVRPGGPAWTKQRARNGLEPAQNLSLDLQRVAAGILQRFGFLLTTEGFLLGQPAIGWISLIVGVGGWMWLRQLNKSNALLMARPGSDRD